jgi:excisionase family DNA binding protein
MSNFLTLKDLCDRFQLSPSVIYEKVANKEIPHIRLGTGPKAPIRFREKDIEAWIESLKVGAVVRPWKKFQMAKKFQKKAVGE